MEEGSTCSQIYKLLHSLYQAVDSKASHFIDFRAKITILKYKDEKSVPKRQIQSSRCFSNDLHIVTDMISERKCMANCTEWQGV